MIRSKITRFIILALMVTLAQVAYSQVQQDCGALDCPGRCGRFVDQNGDGFCDHGRVSAPAKPAEESVIETPNIIVSSPESAEKSNTPDKKNTPKVNETTSASTAVETAQEQPAENDAIDVGEENPTEEPAKPVKNKSPYSLILISSITLGLYLVSFILVKTDVWKKATHRKVWNILLLITGLASCLLGFFLVIQINYNLKMDWLWTVKVYHVQFGIAMTIITVIHILWHTNYWKSIFHKK